MLLRAVRGMKDILPEQVGLWQRFEREFRDLAARYGFGEVRTPLIEPTELFVREIGEGTDVVDKEMYSFERHGDRLTVRPEGTAGCARAYVQHAVTGREPVSRWYYLGPMFRAERPAKGRFRQFHQAGCEIYGDAGPMCDAELIELCATLLRRLGLGEFTIHLSSLGSADVRQVYQTALLEHFKPLAAELSADSRRRLAVNPLRILDSKAPQDQPHIDAAPSIVELLTGADAEHFAALRRYLDALALPYQVDPKLVRGLDYYTRTLFEVRTTSDVLGAQDALIGGGRYDAMIGNLGAKKAVPAIGFAMGIERILTLLPDAPQRQGPTCYLAPMNEPARERALVLAAALRRQGLCCELDGRGLSVKAMLRRANALGSATCLLLGPDELAHEVITVKDLARHEQRQLPIADVVAVMVERFGAGGAGEG